MRDRSANTEAWKYNAKGEVVTADHSTINTFDRSFEFDGIGNRKKSVDGLDLTDASTVDYTANELNQYGSIDGNTRSFDADGNLTNDGVKQYEWDAENRLIAIKQGATTVAEYAYDFRSRRITKTVGATETNFVYDGWNPIAEFSSTTLDKSYVWGMDVSGSMQGAGGVGGLLSVNDGSATYYPLYDGNGNATQYIDSTGAVVASYEYDAFGQVVASGAKSGDFTHQFSTKQLDSESGLHYYGYRYYDSANGRWLGRDPAEEKGGVNLFGFVGNNAIENVDILGLSWKKVNCVDFSIDFSASAYAGVGGSVGIGGSYEMCECCNTSTGEISDKWAHKGEVNAQVSVGIGFGVEVEVLNFRAGWTITGPSVSAKVEASIERDCDGNVKGGASFTESDNLGGQFTFGVGVVSGAGNYNAAVNNAVAIEVDSSGVNLVYSTKATVGGRVEAAVGWFKVGRNFYISEKEIVPETKHSILAW